jgi:hypothetical protein
LQYECPDNFGQQRAHQQRNHRRTGQTDEAHCGKHGFSRVFHATKVKISRATCNSAFSVQFKQVVSSGASRQRDETKTKLKRLCHYILLI